jgi:hypothetical protein
MTTTDPGDLADLAADAHRFGFPLVFNLEQVRRFAEDGLGALPAAPFNTFAHATQLAGPEDTFVSVNNDTVYSIAQLDLRAGPVRLDVPAAGDRYSVLQFVDAWTDNFAYVGRRATGGAAGTYWIVPPGWDGAVPSGATAIAAPTAVVTIVGRWAVAGEDDLPAVAELQRGLRLTPADGGASAAVPAFPEPDPAVPDDLRFFEELRVWSQAFPPAPAELDYAQRFAELGLLATTSPYTADGVPELAEALRAGLSAGRARLEDAVEHGDAPEVHGWRLTYHMFDYNNDYFGIGTLDDPNWRIADRDAARTARAVAARAGLWGNHGYEAAYAMAWVDGDGEPLSGDRSYTLRFGTPPPVDAFWSVTMYDLPEFFLVANPLERYSIGDRTPGLRYGADRSLTLLLQHDDPGEERRANWLPTPPGRFRPILRMYQPRAEVFGGYELPPIRRA